MQQEFSAKTMAILTDQAKLDHTTRWIVRLSASHLDVGTDKRQHAILGKLSEFGRQ